MPDDPRDELINKLVEALRDAQSGLDYIKMFHGRLYGVGFERCETKSKHALDLAKAHGYGGVE